MTPDPHTLRLSHTTHHACPPPVPASDASGTYTIVKDLAIDEFSRGMLKATEKELLEERELALALPAPP